MTRNNKIKSLTGALLTALLLLICTGCRAEREFHVDVASDDIGTQAVTVMYLTENGVHTEELSAVDGRLAVSGTLSSPTLMEFYSAPGVLLGQLIVEGGDEIKARLSAKNPENISIEGSKESTLLNDFIAEHREAIEKGNTDALNRAVDAFVRDNPKRFASAVLLTRYFATPGNEMQATELATLLTDDLLHSPQMVGFEQLLSRTIDAGSAPLGDITAFSTGDTLDVFSPKAGRLNLVMLSDNDCRNTDSIRDLLTALRAGASAPALRITDLGCDRDTMMWRVSLRNVPEGFPAGIDRAWLMAGVATDGVAELAPTDIPYFILADSTGKVLYRGNSAAEVRAAFGRNRALLTK